MISQVDIKHNGTICIMYQSGQKRVYNPSHKLPKTISHFIVMAIAKGHAIVTVNPNGKVTTLY